jgi:hypothetical protein
MFPANHPEEMPIPANRCPLRCPMKVHQTYEGTNLLATQDGRIALAAAFVVRGVGVRQQRRKSDFNSFAMSKTVCPTGVFET